MNTDYDIRNFNDENDNPAGGWFRTRGIVIEWQNGPLGRGKERKEPNGAFVEDVLYAALQRLNYYQDSKFHCYENKLAIDHVKAALEFLKMRTAKREERDVEGTHEP